MSRDKINYNKGDLRIIFKTNSNLCSLPDLIEEGSDE